MNKYLVYLFKRLFLPFYIVRKNGCCYASVVAAIWLISFLLLLWTYQLYQQQTLLMTDTILQIIGRDRNTSAKVLPHVDTTLISPSRSCQFSGKNCLAVILVMTVAKNRAHREIVRTTWASQQYYTNIMVFFFTGKPESGNLSDLHIEALQHGDLIVDDLEDTYYGLGVKSLRMLKWFVRNCPQAKYFIKVDEDVLVNLPLVSIKLKALNPDLQQVGGRLLAGRTPNVLNPFSKWYTPGEMWPSESKAPTYVGGACYIIKGDLVPRMLEASSQIPLYHLEDVFITGMIASQKLNYSLYHFPGSFDPKYPSVWYYWKFLWRPTFSRENITSFHTDGDFDLMRTIYLDSINY